VSNRHGTEWFFRSQPSNWDISGFEIYRKSSHVCQTKTHPIHFCAWVRFLASALQRTFPLEDKSLQVAFRHEYLNDHGDPWAIAGSNLMEAALLKYAHREEDGVQYEPHNMATGGSDTPSVDSHD
jgi:hypothetical protein